MWSATILKPSLPEHLALAKTFEQKYACSAPI
jgi:hypothetical protein